MYTNAVIQMVTQMVSQMVIYAHFLPIFAGLCTHLPLSERALMDSGTELVSWRGERTTPLTL